MRLGLIARADNSGLGIQSWEFHRHMQPDKTLVIDVSAQANDTTHCNKHLHPERFPGAVFSRGWVPEHRVVQQFLDDLDVVFTCETPYFPPMVRECRRRDIRLIIQPNWEFLDHRLSPWLWAAPSTWHYEDIPKPKTLLPVPIATDRFWFRDVEEPNVVRTFLHVVGRPAMYDRNGTETLMEALQHVTARMNVVIRSQDRSYLSTLDGRPVAPNVRVGLAPYAPVNYWDTYTSADVLVMPRRYGGLCLPVNEALGAGMPVIMPDISPNNDWLTPEWLVPAKSSRRLQAKNTIDVYDTDPVALAAMMDRFATDAAFFTQSIREANVLAHEHSWNELKPRYDEVIHG